MPKVCGSKSAIFLNSVQNWINIQNYTIRITIITSFLTEYTTLDNRYTFDIIQYSMHNVAKMYNKVYNTNNYTHIRQPGDNA